VISRAELLAEAPELAEAIRAEAVEAERARVSEILNLVTRSNATLGVDAIRSGISAGEFARRALLAERAELRTAAEAHFADAPLPVPAAAAPQDARPMADRENLHQRVVDHMRATGVDDYALALRQISRSLP
jgi:hypothetical protein